MSVLRQPDIVNRWIVTLSNKKDEREINHNSDRVKNFRCGVDGFELSRRDFNREEKIQYSDTGKRFIFRFILLNFSDSLRSSSED